MPTSAFSVRPICSPCSQPGSAERSACVNVWFPSSNPSRCSRRTRSGWRTTSLPTTKNVAGAWRRWSAATMRGVQRGSGPSSKVSATRLPGPPPRVTSFSPSQVRIGPADASGPPAPAAGVALRPVVRVERPCTPSRTASAPSRIASSTQRDTAPPERVDTLALRRRRRWRCLLRLSGWRRLGGRLGLAAVLTSGARWRRRRLRPPHLPRRGLGALASPAALAPARVDGLLGGGRRRIRHRRRNRHRRLHRSAGRARALALRDREPSVR